MERPFRDKNRFGRIKILFFSAIGLLSFASFGLLGHAENGFQKRIQGWKELKEIPTVNVNYCHNKGRKTSSEMERGEYCFVGNGDLKVSIIGDSHAAALFDAAHDYLATIDKSAIAVSGGFCAPLLNGFEAGEDCKEAIHIALNHAIASEEIETIVLAAEWANYSTGYREDNPPKMWRDDQGIAKNSSENAEIFKRSFSLTFDTLSKSGKNIIIVYPVPEFKQHSYNWIGKQVLFNDIPNVNAAASTLPTISMLDYKKRNKDIFEVFERYSSPNIIYFPVNDLFCSEQQCSQFDASDNVLYSDSNHLNYDGASLVIKKISGALQRQPSF